MRARLTILGFNLAVTTFQIGNTRILGGRSHLEGFQTTVYLSAETMLLTSVALSIASVITFIVSSTLDREGTSDHWSQLTGELLMYLALAQTVVGLFSPYLQMLDIAAMSVEAELEALSVIRIGMTIAGAMAWILATYVGPVVSLIRYPHEKLTKLIHAVAYLGLLVCISHLWWVAQQLEGRTTVGDSSLSAWLNALAAPLFW
jgi:hypothetical protein